MSNHQQQRSTVDTETDRPGAQLVPPPRGRGRIGNAAMQERLGLQGQAPIQVAQAGGRTRAPAAPRETAEQRQRREFGESWDRQRREPVAADENLWRRMTADEITRYDAEVQEGRRTPAAAGTAGHVATVGQDRYVWERPDPQALPQRGDLTGPNRDRFFAQAFPGSRTETVTTRDRRGRETQTERQREFVTSLRADGTTATLNANDQGMVELPTSGYGFTTHNRNDVRINGQAQPDQWGSAANVARTMNTLADYRTMFPGSTISVGDLSDDRGGSPLLYDNNPHRRHGSHYGGSQVDTQYPSGTGSTNRSPTGAEDRFRLNSLVRLGEQRGMDNYYMGTGLNGRMVLDEDTSAGYNAEHNDHLHMGRGTGRQ